MNRKIKKILKKLKYNLSGTAYRTYVIDEVLETIEVDGYEFEVVISLRRIE